jgi:hypothetical protein
VVKVLAAQLGGGGQRVVRADVSFQLGGALGALFNKAHAGGRAHVEFVRSKSFTAEVVRELLVAGGVVTVDPAAWL